MRNEHNNFVPANQTLYSSENVKIRKICMSKRLTMSNELNPLALQ